MPSLKIIRIRICLIFILIWLSGVNAAFEPASGSLKVLFIGSSYTGYYDMPQMVEQLAETAGHTILVDTHLAYGRSLYEISLYDAVWTKISSNDWDYIILQDAPHRVAYPETYANLIPWADTHPLPPTLKTFRDRALENYSQTRVLFFMPWAFKDGMLWITGQTDDFFNMQENIYTNSILFATELNLAIAPVGWAFYTVLREHSDIELFDSDYSHSSLEGSYLAASVFFTSFYRESLSGNNYYNTVPEDRAVYLQNIASSTVLDYLDTWLLITGIKYTAPENFDLLQNFPNPFNARTVIPFHLKQADFVSLDVIDLTGKKVRTLIQDQIPAGKYSILLKANQLASGIYFYRLQTKDATIVKTMILRK